MPSLAELFHPTLPLVLSGILTLTSILNLWWAGNRYRWNWLAWAGFQVFWVWFGIITGGYLLILSAVIFFFVNLRNYRKWGEKTELEQLREEVTRLRKREPTVEEKLADAKPYKPGDIPIIHMSDEEWAAWEKDMGEPL